MTNWVYKQTYNRLFPRSAHPLIDTYLPINVAKVTSPELELKFDGGGEAGKSSSAKAVFMGPGEKMDVEWCCCFCCCCFCCFCCCLCCFCCLCCCFCCCCCFFNCCFVVTVVAHIVSNSSEQHRMQQHGSRRCLLGCHGDLLWMLLSTSACFIFTAIKINKIPLIIKTTTTTTTTTK